MKLFYSATFERLDWIKREVFLRGELIEEVGEEFESVEMLTKGVVELK
jgi:hypothetical protein